LFEQEAQAAAALNHPNILAVYQFGVFEGAPYLVSELLEGSTLRRCYNAAPCRFAKRSNTPSRSLMDWRRPMNKELFIAT
jgi:serine/threonine protein kinase